MYVDILAEHGDAFRKVKEKTSVVPFAAILEVQSIYIYICVYINKYIYIYLYISIYRSIYLYINV